MANFRRRYPRARTPGGGSQVRHWPKWWDVLNHTRPHRRLTREFIILTMKGYDPDNLAWPLDKRPHQYYW